MNQTKSAKKKSSKQPLSFLADSKENKCKYHLPGQTSEAEYSCPYEIVGLIYCVFHFPKLSATQMERLPSKEKLSLTTIEHSIEYSFDYSFEKLLSYSENSEFVDMRGFKFRNQVDFRLPFLAKADFSHAVFYQDIDFGTFFPNPKPEHEYDTERKTLLKKGASFESCNFKGKADFSGCEVETDLNFRDAIFEKSALLENLNCDGNAGFEKTVFEDNTSFSKSNFKNVYFHNTKFKKETDFWRFSVGISTSFAGSVFDQKADFIESSFGFLCTNYDEEGNKFEKNTDGYISFDRITFNDSVLFYDVEFLTDVNFDGAIFKKQTQFVSERSNMFEDTSSFCGLSLPKDEDFTFEQVNLNKARFTDTNLEKITFRDVLWGTEKTKWRRLFLGNRYILWDQIRPLEGNRDYINEGKIAENYRQLVLNFESKRDYETAEQFHIGEMEMRRRKVGNSRYYSDYNPPSKLKLQIFSKLGIYQLLSFWSQIRKYLNGYGLYWLSSRYGTSYTQAILLLLMLMSIFSFLFMFSGVKTSKDVSTDNPRIIEYNVFQDSDHILTSPVKFLSDYKETLSYTLSIITFQKERFYEPLDWQARYLLYLAVFTLTAQSALIFLAIRRQFKR